jgi:transcriptional regulator with XRE-family HTH domain
VESPTLKRLLARLRQLREVHGLTQEDFAELSGITYKYYQQIEAGRKPELRLSTLERLAKAYGIEVFQLLSPEQPKTKITRTVKRPATPR